MHNRCDNASTLLYTLMNDMYSNLSFEQARLLQKDLITLYDNYYDQKASSDPYSYLEYTDPNIPSLKKTSVNWAVWVMKYMTILINTRIDYEKYGTFKDAFEARKWQDAVFTQLDIDKLKIPSNVFVDFGPKPPAYMDVLKNLYTIEGSIQDHVPFKIALHPLFQAILCDQKEVIDKYKKLREENGDSENLKNMFRGSERLMAVTQLNIISLNEVTYPTFVDLYLNTLELFQCFDKQILDFTKLFPNVVNSDKRYIKYSLHLNELHLKQRSTDDLAPEEEEDKTTMSKTSISFAGGMVKDKRRSKIVKGSDTERRIASRSEVNKICHVICETIKICLPAARSMGSSELAEMAWRWTESPSIKQNDDYFGGYHSPGYLRDLIVQLVRGIVSCGGYKTVEDLSGVVFITAVSHVGALIRFFGNLSDKIAKAKREYAKEQAVKHHGSGWILTFFQPFS